jgi:hypothetical protein
MRRIHILTILAIVATSVWLVAFTAEPNAANPNITPTKATEVIPPLAINPPIQPRVLFADDFRNRNFTETHWTEEGGEWDIINGRYTLSYNGISLAGANSWSNYTYVVDVLGINVIDKIIYFRYLAPDNSYGVDFRSHPYNDIVLTKNIPGQGYVILTSAPRQNYNDAYYSLKFILKGARIQIFVNDILVIDYTDTNNPILKGRIGLSGMLSVGSKVLFDHVEVTAP